jgi:hypothetical protein
MLSLKTLGLTLLVLTGLVVVVPKPTAIGQDEKNNANEQIQSKQLPDVKAEKDASPKAVDAKQESAELEEAQFVFVSATAKPRWMWCTEYLASKMSLPWTFPDAKNWGPWLQKNGWRQVNVPQAGCIIVYQPGAHGIKEPGHVGIAWTVQPVKGGWTGLLRGANQGGKQFTDAGATDVSDINFSITQGERFTTFWVKAK